MRPDLALRGEAFAVAREHIGYGLWAGRTLREIAADIGMTEQWEPKFEAVLRAYAMVWLALGTRHPAVADPDRSRQRSGIRCVKARGLESA